jgi:hypothetical protein
LHGYPLATAVVVNTINVITNIVVAHISAMPAYFAALEPDVIRPENKNSTNISTRTSEIEIIASLDCPPRSVVTIAAAAAMPATPNAYFTDGTA